MRLDRDNISHDGAFIGIEVNRDIVRPRVEVTLNDQEVSIPTSPCVSVDVLSHDNAWFLKRRRTVQSSVRHYRSAKDDKAQSSPRGRVRQPERLLTGRSKEVKQKRQQENANGYREHISRVNQIVKRTSHCKSQQANCQKKDIPENVRIQYLSTATRATERTRFAFKRNLVARAIGQGPAPSSYSSLQARTWCKRSSLWSLLRGNSEPFSYAYGCCAISILNA
jgi:hypothetical protein